MGVVIITILLSGVFSVVVGKFDGLVVVNVVAVVGLVVPPLVLPSDVESGGIGLVAGANVVVAVGLVVPPVGLPAGGSVAFGLAVVVGVFVNAEAGVFVDGGLFGNDEVNVVGNTDVVDEVGFVVVVELAAVGIVKLQANYIQFKTIKNTYEFLYKHLKISHINPVNQ